MSAAPPARGGLRRSLADRQEIDRLSAHSHSALETLERGEALAAAGAIEPAEALFQQAHALDPDGSLLYRRDCEALTTLGRRASALSACTQAVQNARTSENFRALIRALVDGPAQPTPLDLANALLFTATERDQSSPKNPTAAAALCDIAASLGDGVMLQHCAETLDRLAPDDLEARRGRSVLAARCPPWRFWTGWSVILAAIAASMAHAARASWRRRLRPAAPANALGALLCFGLSAAAGSARAVEHTPDEGALHPVQEGYLSIWPVDDSNPEAHIPSETDRNANPIQFGYWLQDVALKGEHASKEGDHPAASRYYATLARAVPDRAIGYTKMCDELEAAGELEKATNVCGTALTHDGLLVKDYVHYVHLILTRPGPLTGVQLKTMAAVLGHMKEDPAGQDAAFELECEVGSRTANVADLRECTDALAAKDPNNVKTVSYQWSLALAEGKFDDAEKLVERARTLGLKGDGVDKMALATSVAGSQQRNRRMWGILGAVLFLGALGVGLRTLLGRRRAPAVAA